MRHTKLTVGTLRGLVTAWACGAILHAVSARADGPPVRRPNVIVIVSDDLGYNDLSIQGSPDIATPHIDSIGQHGARFTNAYVTGPLCGPSRAGIMSGRYQERHSYDFMPGPDEGLSPKEATMGDAFRAAGYATAAVGKWNLGVLPQYRPLARGFDHFLGFLGALHPYVPGQVATDVMMVGEHPRPGWCIPPDSANYEAPAKPGPATKGATTAAATGPATKATATTKPAIGGKAGFLVRGDKEVAEPTYLTDAFTRDAIDFIDHHGVKPYFLYLAYNASHSPLQPPKKYLDRFPHLKGKRRLYAATTSALDDGVGQVLAEVAKLGQASDTIVVFVNDNGGPITDTEASNAPLSGTKGSLWEGGIRVPFLVQWPGVVRAGATLNDLTIALDIYPTVLAASGVHVPPGKQLEGVDLMPLLSGKPQPVLTDRTLFWRFGNQWAVRQGNWKLELPERGSPKLLLFDLGADVGEDHDLSKQNPDEVRRLTEQWKAWDQFNLPPPDDAKRAAAHGNPRPVPFREADWFRDNDT
jgi:arylsulfatase B